MQKPDTEDAELERIKKEKMKKLLEKMKRGENKMAEVKHVTRENFSEEILESDLPVIVDFWAEWCMPCRIVAPIFEELANEYAGKLKFAKVNVDEAPELAASFGVTGIPAFLVFHNGRVIERAVGAMPKEQLKKFIDRALSLI